MEVLFQIESLDEFQNVVQKVLSNLYCSGQKFYSTLIDIENINLAKKELITIISDCNFDIQEIEKVISKKEWQEEKVLLFQSLFRKNKTDILFAAYNHYNSNYCETVVNFDWCAKIALGTSELKTLRTPLLQLTLSTINKSGKIKKTMYEIDKEMLLKMINVLENIK